MMTSSFGKPRRFGMRTCRSGLPPATQAAVAMRQRRGAAAGDDAPLGAGQLGEAGADRLGELVEVHVVLRGRVHRRAHFRQHRRTADDGEGAAGVDQRPDADRRVDVGAVQRGRGGGHHGRTGGAGLRGRGHGGRGRFGAQQYGEGQHAGISAPSQQLSSRHRTVAHGGLTRKAGGSRLAAGGLRLAAGGLRLRLKPRASRLKPW